ncbi:MAG: flavin reductase family protein, partial [Eubacterium sp.]|nr:flavin reductase family protein [Eubacterium sp.]
MFKEIEFTQVKDNVVDLLKNRWGLVTAGDKNGFNTMTAGWGYLGVLWNRPSAIVLVRPSRHTYGYVNDN